MRVTNKGARAFFIWTLLAFVVMLCVIGYSMAEAFNLSPYTFKLRSKTTAADSLYIKGDTLYMNQMAVSLAAVMKAVAVQTDTLRGSSSVVGIVDDTLIVDTDSTGSLVTIRFGRWGGGIRWNQSTDAMQYTNDFSTWTDIGTGGSSTTNADSLDGAVAHVRPMTDGYYLRYAATGDSLYLAAVTGSTDEDSIFVAHKSSRWLPLPDSSGQYMGATTDSTMLWYNLTDDNIISYVKVFYNEDVTDSALVTWGSMLAQIATSGNGDITGVITSAPLTGGAASGDVSLGFDWTWLYGFNDTMTARVPYASAADSIWTASNALITANNGAIYLLAPSPVNGGLFVQIGGNAQLTIDTGTVMFNRRIRVGVDTVQDLTGTGLAVSGYALTATLGTAITSSEITDDEILWQDLDSADAKIAIRDVVHDSLIANWSTFITTDTATLHLASKANIKDSIHTARTMASIWTLSADWVNTANPWADNEVADNITAGYADSTGKTTHGSVDKWDLATNSIDSTKIVDAGVGYADLGVGAVNRIKSTVVDSATGALRASLLIAGEGSANTAGRLTLDSLIVDTAFATRMNVTNLKVGSDAFITDITGTGISISAGALTATLGTSISKSEIDADAVDSTKIGDGGISWADMGAGIKTTRVRFNNVHGQDHALGDACILSLEGVDATGTYPYMYRDSSTATDAEDTVFMSALIPENLTQADSLILIWKTSSATGTTSRIISIDLYVTTGGGTSMSASQFNNTTDYSETTIQRTALSLSADGDFNSGEIASLRIIFNGDANAFLKVYGAHLVCR